MPFFNDNIELVDRREESINAYLSQYVVAKQHEAIAVNANKSVRVGYDGGYVTIPVKPMFERHRYRQRKNDPMSAEVTMPSYPTPLSRYGSRRVNVSLYDLWGMKDFAFDGVWLYPSYRNENDTMTVFTGIVERPSPKMTADDVKRLAGYRIKSKIVAFEFRFADSAAVEALLRWIYNDHKANKARKYVICGADGAFKKMYKEAKAEIRKNAGALEKARMLFGIGTPRIIIDGKCVTDADIPFGEKL